MVWSHVHQLHFLRLKYREVALVANFYTWVDKASVRVNRSVSLGNDLFFFLFSAKEHRSSFELNASVVYFAVRSLDEAHRVDLGVDTE